MELLVAVFIISTALVGIMSLINTVISSASYSTARLTAAHLAQEGIEIVKGIRDLNYEQPAGCVGWDCWWADFSGTTSYIAQYDDSDLRPLSNVPLKYNAATWLYGYDAGIDTPFNYKRVITITKNPSGLDGNEIRVSVQVTWTERTRQGSVVAEDRLWRWRSF